MANKTKIVIEDFNLYFPNQDKPFLKNISTTIKPGEFVAIVGPSSSGKSTLALALTGIYPHVLSSRTEGQIRVGELDIASSTVAEITTKVGLVFQDPDSQFCNLFVEEELAFGPENLLFEKKRILNNVETYLQFVDMEGFNLNRIVELSGGQKQRVAIASVLAMEPDVLILDQPTANIDPSGKEDVFETLYKINQETGKTLILLEHQIDALIRYVDKLIVMNEGRIEYQGAPREILSKYGRVLEEQYGLWIPEVSRAGLFLQESQIACPKFPITVEELGEVFYDNSDSIFNKACEKPEIREDADGKNIIEIKNVSFSYPLKDNVLTDVSFNIKEGSIVSLMGENGSGKTTLSKMIVGLLRPQKGEILVDGLDVTKATMKEICSRVGYVFQYPDHQFVTNTVYEEVGYGLKKYKYSEEEKKAIIAEIIHKTELEGLEDRHPFTLSMGEKRRLSIATMLVLKPKILILDEPSAGLDYKNCEHMMHVITKLKQLGVTVIMISHTTYLVAKYSEHVFVMDKGRIVFEGSARELFRDLENIQTKAIAKPELLQAIEYTEAKMGKTLPCALVADDLCGMIEGGGIDG